MELTIAYDMRAPAFGAKATELYAAALDQVAWADELGFAVVGLGEHHAAEDAAVRFGNRPTTHRS